MDSDKLYAAMADIYSSIEKVELALANEMDNNGRGMTPGEIAATIVAFAMNESSTWLKETLHFSTEQRLAVILSIDHCLELLRQPKE
jgi:hypothetical protein